MQCDKIDVIIYVQDKTIRKVGAKMTAELKIVDAQPKGYTYPVNPDIEAMGSPNNTKAAVIVELDNNPRILVIAATIELAMWALEKVTKITRHNLSYENGAWYPIKGIPEEYEDALVYIVHESQRTVETQDKWGTDYASTDPLEAAYCMAVMAELMNKAQLKQIQDLLIKNWS